MVLIRITEALYNNNVLYYNYYFYTLFVFIEVIQIFRSTNFQK